MEVETESGRYRIPSLPLPEREVESWLISLAVRLLWKDGKYPEAFKLSQDGIYSLVALWIASYHQSVSPIHPVTFPARMYRLRSWRGIAGCYHCQLVDMAKAHNMATLWR
jgi:hypothetical protein